MLCLPEYVSEQKAGYDQHTSSFEEFIERHVEPKVKVPIPMYEPLQDTKCEECGKIIAQPKELIRIQKR